jgi:hypothetical protein
VSFRFSLFGAPFFGLRLLPTTILGIVGTNPEIMVHNYYAIGLFPFSLTGLATGGMKFDVRPRGGPCHAVSFPREPISQNLTWTR